MQLGIVPVKLLFDSLLRPAQDDHHVKRNMRGRCTKLLQRRRTAGPQTHSCDIAVRAPMLLGIVPLS